MMLIVDASIRVSVVLAIALVTSAAMRRRAAAARHGLLAAALLLSALVAPLSWVLPAVHVGFPHWVFPARPGMGSSVVETSLTSFRAAASDTSSTIAAAVVVLWIAGTLAYLVVLLRAFLRLRRVERAATPVLNGRWRELADQIGAENRLRRPVRLLRTTESNVLATWGARRPCIAFPCTAEDWSSGHIRTVLQHEVAHVARHDWLVQMVTQVFCAWQWFNPLCWLALRRLREYGEMACDDAALRSGLVASEYAERLVEIARTCRAASLAPVSVEMARRSSLQRRIAAMLNPGIDRRPRSRWATAATFATLSLLVVPAAALTGAQGAKPSDGAAAPAARPVTLKVGGAIKPPRKIHDVQPVYPEAMKEAKISGSVELEVTIGQDGVVRKVHVLTTDIHPDLAVAAVDAVRQWKFEPTLMNGAPVDVMMKCTIAFRLD